MCTCCSRPRYHQVDVKDFRWCPPSPFCILLLTCVGSLVVIDILQLQNYLYSSPWKPRQGFLVKTSGCKIIDMDPFDPTIKKYYEWVNPIVCNDDKPALVNSNSTAIFFDDTALEKYGIPNRDALYCSYVPFYGNKPNVAFSDSVKITDEFIKVRCFYRERVVYVDFFSFVPVKSKKSDLSDYLNVLVIGIDSMSRLNLHRQMPKTINFLKNISVELLGYNKVGDNTYPNLIPVLTGLTEGELESSCEPSKNAFDDCPMIWKKFSERGFLTAFGEDSFQLGLFQFARKGFKKPPTDYYWNVFNRKAERKIRNARNMNTYICLGARYAYKTLLDYVATFTKTMVENEKPFFGFFWAVSLTHDEPNYAQISDDDYVNFFSDLSGYLNNTVVIFMSDHGHRYGKMRRTTQGRMEEKLPFVFITLPKIYQIQFPEVYTNLRRNARRLTTPFDLHETISDLLNPFHLNGTHLDLRTESRKNNSRSYSLFEWIPPERTCHSAAIASHWCTCQKSFSMDTSATVVVQAAKFAVATMNSMLEGYAECAVLRLSRIIDANKQADDHLLKNKLFVEDYTITFSTTPSDAIFEATVRKLDSKYKNQFTVTGTISRLNMYGQQSSCVTDFHLKLYCYCVNYNSQVQSTAIPENWNFALKWW